MDRMQQSTSTRWTGTALIVLGTLFLLQQLGWLQIGQVLRFIWPLLLIYLGWTLYRQDKETERLSADETFKKSSFFGDFEVLSAAKKLKQGHVWSVFGDGTIDLREATFDGQASLDIVGVFADIKIRVPPQTRIHVDAVTMLSDVQALAYDTGDAQDTKRTLRLTGFTLFSDIHVDADPPLAEVDLDRHAERAQM